MMKTLSIAIVDDDESVREGLGALLGAQGHTAVTYVSTESFLADDCARFDCILLDLWFHEGVNGIGLLRHLLTHGIKTPVIMMTRQADIETAFLAGELGAVSYLPKPIRSLELAAIIAKAVVQERRPRTTTASPDACHDKLASLTPAERKILDRLILDHPNKQIARELNLSVRTVESHRAHITEKLNTRSKIEMREMLEAHKLLGEADDNYYSRIGRRTPT